MRDPQRQVDASADKLGARHAQEVVGGQFVVEDHEDVGPGAVVVRGALRGVVAQVGGEAGGHRRGMHRPALPLKEEGPALSSQSYDSEGVGLDGVEPVMVGEVARGAAGRVELDDLGAGGAGLRGQCGEEAMHGLRVPVGRDVGDS